MYFVKCIVAVLLASQATHAEISLKDYVFWTKADMTAWHQYFPSRLLEQERLTIQAAIDTVTTLMDTMNTSLAATVRYQEQELETAQFSMEGTSAQGCIRGISTYMDRAVAEGVEYFQDCVADVPASLRRVNVSWAKTSASYDATYQRALVGIDTCARTYPNRGSWNRLKTCVEAWTTNYFTTANSTTDVMSWSRSMSEVGSTVASCAQAAARDVVDKGKKFLGMLVQCAKLSENINSIMYEQELISEFDKYITSNDLTTQISNSGYLNTKLVGKIEEQMIYYYALQKRALEKYVIESRNQSFYYGQMVQYLQKYLYTISSTSIDNPANVDCISQANVALSNNLNTGAAKALECDSQIVNRTKFLIARVNEYFSIINNILPYTGNVAILSCFSEGYIFAEQTVADCYSLALEDYEITITALNTKIVDDVRELLGYEDSFFSNSSLPCGDSILRRAFLEADRTLYNLQRCLYIGTGTKYAVTTVAPYTTTVQPSPA